MAGTLVNVTPHKVTVKIRWDDVARLRLDLERRFRKFPDYTPWQRVCYLAARPQYQCLILYRLSRAGRDVPVVGRLLRLLHGVSSLVTGLEILTDDLGGGVIVPHFGSIKLSANSVGEGLYVMHGVTVGNDYRRGRPTVGSNVFIGANALVLGPVAVGGNAMIAAGAVVTRDVPPNSVVAGNPACIVRHIDDDEISRMIGY